MAAELLAFMSYASEDRDRVLAVYDEVARMGVRPWMDVKDLVGGEQWERAIERTLRRATFVLLFLSGHSVAKRGVLRKEIVIALDALKEKLPDDLYLIPLRLDDCDVPDELRPFQWIDLFATDWRVRLRSSIVEGLARRGLAPTTSRDGVGVRLAASSWKSSDSRVDVDLKIPQVYGLTDPSDELFVNDVIRTEVEQRAREFVAYTASSGGDFSCGAVAKRVDQRLISIYIGFDYYASGAAHGSVDMLSLNFALRPAWRLAPRHLFGKHNWQEVLTRLCVAALRAESEGEDSTDLDEKIQSAFQEGDVHFSFTSENLVLTFAPGVLWWRIPDQVAIPLTGISALLAERLPLRMQE